MTHAKPKIFLIHYSLNILSLIPILPSLSTHLPDKTTFTIKYSKDISSKNERQAQASNYSAEIASNSFRFKKGPLGFSEDNKGTNTESTNNHDQLPKVNNYDSSCLIKTTINICNNDDDGTFCTPLKDKIGNYISREISLNICSKSWTEEYNNHDNYYNISIRYIVDKINTSPPIATNIATAAKKKICLSKKKNSIIHKGPMMENFPVPSSVLTNPANSSTQGKLPADANSPPAADEVPAVCYGN